MMLKNKIALITGASSGIGAAIANHFAGAGIKLVLCARRLEKLEQHASLLRDQYGVEIFCLQLDVRDREAVKETLANIPDNYADIDILVNNAGLAAGLDPLQSGEIDDWEIMIDTNVKGLLYVTRFVLPNMVAKDAGHIINIGSVAGHYVYPKGAVYCATKYAVHALTQGLRMDLLGKKIRVSTIDPGAVHTDFSVVRFKGDENRASAVYEGMQPLTAEDIADAVFYCVSRPAHVNISEMLMMPTDQAAATMVARK